MADKFQKIQRESKSESDQSSEAWDSPTRDNSPEHTEELLDIHVDEAVETTLQSEPDDFVESRAAKVFTQICLKPPATASTSKAGEAMEVEESDEIRVIDQAEGEFRSITRWE